ncbi:MAG TPA: hypothetical protein VE913_06765 [Longimicrobium sp.]|nr:hypothetical protein [Longimicrobium sp.]
MRTLHAMAAVALLSGCGDDAAGIAVRGDFAPGARSPTSVYALEAGRAAEVGDKGFSLADLATAPISLRVLVDGDTAGRIDLPDLPDGAELTLRGLRMDAASGWAFPAEVELKGASSVMVNGIRMMNSSALPGSVDATGVILAASADRAALLIRPGDDGLPDLRVVVSQTTATVTPDSQSAVLSSVSVGDSVRVQGPTDRGFVLADRLTLIGIPSSVGVVSGPAESVTGSAESATGEERGSATPRESPAPRAAVVPVPVARSAPPAVQRRTGSGGGRGSERGRGSGRGNGNGNGKAKKKG